jgi:hypothetical protein
MALRDRDYMKRPSDDDGSRDVPAESKVEELAGRFLRKKPRLLLYLGVGFGVLLLIAHKF